MTTICELIREAEQNYTQGTTKMSKYVDLSMYETIETIDAYLNSVHTSGKTDSLGREKPFFNIVTAATNIWYRATDIDRKNIRITPDNSSSVAAAFLAQAHLQKWMDKNRFGVFLNQWGRTLAKYGSAIVKFVSKNGDLIPSVIPWNRFIADPVDFNSIPRIEKYYKTIEQLRKMPEYDQKVVDSLVNARQSRETLDGMNKDTTDHFIEVFEVHGELPTYLLDKDPQPPKDEKDVKYRQQMHVVSFVQNKKGDYDDFTLFKGIESKDPYMLTHLIEEDGRTLAIGAVEYLFDAQWMQNHSIKQWKDQIDLASKLIFQTSDMNFVGRNVLSAIENGDIMIHALNQPLTLINNQGHDITSIQAFTNQWKILTQEITSTPESMRGSQEFAGTPYRSTALLTQQANSLFEIMTENKGLAIEDMLREFVIPHLKTKLNNSDEIMATLEDYNITQLDTMYVPRQAIKNFNKRIVEEVLALNPEKVQRGEMPQPFNPMMEQGQIQQSLSPLGNMRALKPSKGDVNWKEVFKDLEWNVKVEVTNENKDKAATLQTLSTIFQTLAQIDPQKAQMVFNKILTETGVVSPMELNMQSTGAMAQQAQMAQGSAVGGLSALGQNNG